MTPPYGFRKRQQQSEHHLLLACLAVFLSAVFHVVLIYVFSDWAISGCRNLRERGREWFEGDRVPPMRVETLRADPMRIADKVAGERDLPSRGPIEVSDQVDALRQAASPALTVPPPIPREALAPGIPSLKDSPARQVDTTPWMPRQEIAQIYDRTVQDAVAALPRREIPMVERVPRAPDIVPSIDLVGRRFGADPEPPKPLKAAEVFDTEISKGTYKPPMPTMEESPSKVAAEATESRFALRPGERNGVSDGTAEGKRLADRQAERIEKQLEAVANQNVGLSEEERKAREAQIKLAAIQDTVEYEPIDDWLAVGLETYRDAKDTGRVYFRIGIEAQTNKLVATLAKDIVFVQDVSASMTEERVAFCRRGLTAALETLNPGDRFNVVAFRDTFASCFQGWASVSGETKRQAAEFVASMRAFGQTDVFGSLRELMKMPRDPKRPMIAFVVTDGKPTFGMTESAKIIGAFSELNGGVMAVNMFGTQSKANAYLLDMLTYCNRGQAAVLSGNRWDIPQAMASSYEGLRDPVMSDITVSFDSASQSEVYPKRTGNLYRGRQLQLFGACPEGTEELVFQIRGLAAGKGYDSVVRLSLTRHARLGSAAVRQRWALQKMYHLVAEYSRDTQQQTFAEMLKVNQKYDVQIPYESELKR